MRFCSLLTLSVLAVAAAQQPAAPAKAKPAAPKAAKPAARKSAAAAKPGAPAAPSQPAAGSPSAGAVITMGDQRITREEYETFIRALPEQFQMQARGPQKREIAEQLVRVKLLANEARRRGLDKEPQTLARIQFQTENMLAGSLFQSLQNDVKVDAAAVQKYYDEHKNEYEQAKARHILIKFKGSPAPGKPGQKELSEEEALAKTQDLRKRILAGEDFAALAKEHSDDTGSGAQGGDLGSFKRGTMVPAFEQAAFTQKPGDVSEPIKTQFGYHLIRVDSRESKTLDEVRPMIEQQLRPQLAREAVEKLRTGATVTFDESYFGTPAPPTAPAAPGSSSPASAPKPPTPPAK